MQPQDIQLIVAAILTLAATPLKTLPPGASPESEVLRTFFAFGQVLSGQAPQMSPEP
jgi:hypothetical protein